MTNFDLKAESAKYSASLKSTSVSIDSSTTDSTVDLTSIEKIDVFELDTLTLLNRDNIKSLRKVHIDGCNISDLDLLSLSNGMLTVVKITRCPKLTGKDVAAFINANVGIVHLDISLMPQIEDPIIAEAVSHMKRLETFRSDQSIKLGNATLNAVASSCEFIREISMNGCNVEGGGMGNIRICQNLHLLSLVGCQRLTAEMLVNFSSSVGKLKVLDVSYIIGITPPQLNDIKNAFPTIQLRINQTAQFAPPILLPPPKVKKTAKPEK